MRRTALLAGVLVIAAACVSEAGSTTSGEAATTPPEGFPVTVADDTGPVTIETLPGAIVSLSATATEMLFAMGAGDQVVAVDDQSDHPAEAPTTDLSGFTPNVEAILAYDPDLVVISFDPVDNPVSEALEAVGVPVLVLDAAMTIDDVYRQIEVLGDATGNPEGALTLNDEIRLGIDQLVGEFGQKAAGVTYYHELDSTLFTVTSSTFIGEIYALLGMVNIADAADPGGESSGFPQLSAEYIVSADPDIVFLADAEFAESLETVGARPGWAGMSAVESGAVVELDADIASRWGPRIVEFLRVIADAVDQHAPAGAGTG